MTLLVVAMIDQSINQVNHADFFRKEGVSACYETLLVCRLCECGYCNSIYSPSAYYVELLQYIRNNNLDPENAEMEIDPTNPSGPRIQRAGFAGTPLEHLFDRRPDLKCLELTCENALYDLTLLICPMK
ncbi:MAG: hypothetical protein IPJ13_23965 [Saprospiraceae bacterium]|nr:hypothetical protein [Saprospiraceae bacterium]